MSSTIRAFFNKKRIATGRSTKDGRFFQAFPFKKYFETESEWREYVSKTMNQPLSFTVESSYNSKKVHNLIKKISTNPNALSHTLPPGRYYIGDLCFVMQDKYFDVVIDNLRGHFEAEGVDFMFDGTAHGDGVYEGSDGSTFAVDAGNIGIAHESLCELSGMFLTDGSIINFHEPINCIFVDGVFSFKSGDWNLVIDTRVM